MRFVYQLCCYCVSEGEYNWWNIGYLHWASWADYIGYIGLTPHVGTQCGTIPIYSNSFFGTDDWRMGNVSLGANGKASEGESDRAWPRTRNTLS
jgi:hypothetical protein